MHFLLVCFSTFHLSTDEEKAFKKIIKYFINASAFKSSFDFSNSEVRTEMTNIYFHFNFEIPTVQKCLFIRLIIIIAFFNKKKNEIKPPELAIYRSFLNIIAIVMLFFRP